jgi:hypothetical protein
MFNYCITKTKKVNRTVQARFTGSISGNGPKLFQNIRAAGLWLMKIMLRATFPEAQAGNLLDAASNVR